jgi:hypothetical protein
MTTRLIISVAAVVLAGCSPTEIPVEAPSQEALWGPVTFVAGNGTSTCTFSPDEQAFVLQSIARGRAISRSQTFETCIRTAMPATISLTGDVHASGRVSTQLGPYDFCAFGAGDPQSAISASAVLANTRSPLGVSISCDPTTNAGELAHADITTTPGLNEQLAYLEPRLATSIAAGDLNFTAGIVWHEAMHQHGYEHGASGKAEDCGYPATAFTDDDSGWFFRHTIPYLVTSCMTYIGDISDSCPATCPSGFTALRTALDPTAPCDCFDNTVSMNAGPITIDASILGPQQGQLAGYWLFDAKSPQIIELPSGTYTMQSSMCGTIGSFSVTTTGTVNYSTSLNGVFSGRGTSSLKVIGYAGCWVGTVMAALGQ